MIKSSSNLLCIQSQSKVNTCNNKKSLVLFIGFFRNVTDFMNSSSSSCCVGFSLVFVVVNIKFFFAIKMQSYMHNKYVSRRELSLMKVFCFVIKLRCMLIKKYMHDSLYKNYSRIIVYGTLSNDINCKKTKQQQKKRTPCILL